MSQALPAGIDQFFLPADCVG